LVPTRDGQERAFTVKSGMLRCLSCNGILQKSETVCYSCGEKIDGAAKAKSKGSFYSVAAMLFYISLGATGLSIFTKFGPPLAVCVPATIVLMFVKSSADQVKKNQT